LPRLIDKPQTALRRFLDGGTPALCGGATSANVGLPGSYFDNLLGPAQANYNSLSAVNAHFGTLAATRSI
jgi:hypothetical protein